MDQMRSSFKINKRRYDQATDVVREELGSYEAIAELCRDTAGVAITGNAIRRWVVERCIPVEYAALFSDLTLGQVVVTDFYPWLTKYVK